MPWFFYQWVPNLEETIVAEAKLQGFPVVSAYLKLHVHSEDPLAVRYLEACRNSAFSFMHVIDVTLGSGFILRDALSGWEGPVTEKSASQTVQTGDILFANVVTLDHVTVLDGCAPIAFPPLERVPIMALRKRISKANPAVTAEVLRDYGMEMLEIDHSTADRLLDRRMPALANTDGDPLALCRVTYEIPSGRAAFESLLHLSQGHSQDELLADALFDPAGQLTSVEIPWLKRGHGKMQLESISLGHIQIEGRRLVAEVNSEERARRFRKIAEEVLPSGSRHTSTVIESIDAALDAHRRDQPDEPEEDDLNKRPEVQAMLKEHLQAHYRA